MKRCIRNYGSSRPKAFWGAVIGAATSLAGGLLNASQQRKQAEAQKHLEDYANAMKIANASADAINQSAAAEQHYQAQFRQPFRKGGRRRLNNVPYITDGGSATPIGGNAFLLRGGSHEDINESGNTGIGINVNGKEVEAEGGEVAQSKPNELRIFSKERILPGGVSPAEAVMAGANKDYIFNQQESIKGQLGIDNEGNPVAAYGNLYYLTAPQQQLAAGVTAPISMPMRQPISGISNLSRWLSLANAGKTGGLRNPSESASDILKQADALAAKNKKAIATDGFRFGGRSTPPVERRRKALLGDNEPIRRIPSLRSVISPNYYDEGTMYTGQINPDWFDANGRPYNNVPIYNAQLATKQADGSWSLPDVDVQPNPVLTNPKVAGVNADRTLAVGDNYEGPKITVDLDDSIEGRSLRDRMGMIVKGGDWIGLGADLIGSLGLGWINANAAKDGYAVPDAPGFLQAAKLNTTYNINPQLADNERNRLATNRAIARDTLSSVGSLARQGTTNIGATSTLNQLYGEKENKENEYINADALNQQEVAAKNIALQQDWRDKATAIRNEQARAKAQARNISLQGISGAAGNFLGQTMQRYEDIQALKAYVAASEEGTGARLVAAGLDDTGELSKTGLTSLQGKLKPLDGLDKEQRKVQQGYRDAYKVMYNNLYKSRGGRRWLRRNGLSSMPNV